MVLGLVAGWALRGTSTGQAGRCSFASAACGNTGIDSWPTKRGGGNFWLAPPAGLHGLGAPGTQFREDYLFHSRTLLMAS